MKILLILSLISSVLYANDYKKSKNEVLSLQKEYNLYIDNIINASNNIESIKKLDSNLDRKKPTITNILFSNGKNLQMPNLDFFDKVNTIDTYNPLEILVEDKLFTAQLDRAKLNTYLFMLTNLQIFDQGFKKNKNSSKKLYKQLFKKSELYLLALAKKALTVPTQEAELLTTEFNLLVLQLSAVPFPPEYSFYRRRMLYSLDTPQAARNEINRIENSLKQMK